MIVTPQAGFAQSVPVFAILPIQLTQIRPVPRACAIEDTTNWLSPISTQDQMHTGDTTNTATQTYTVSIACGLTHATFPRNQLNRSKGQDIEMTKDIQMLPSIYRFAPPKMSLAQAHHECQYQSLKSGQISSYQEARLIQGARCCSPLASCGSILGFDIIR